MLQRRPIPVFPIRNPKSEIRNRRWKSPHCNADRVPLLATADFASRAQSVLLASHGWPPFNCEQCSAVRDRGLVRCKQWHTILENALFCIAAVFALAGCRQETSVVAVKQSQQEQLRQADRADALLKAAANQLGDLPSAVDTELRPPVVVLDSRKSADGQDVYAVCTANPAVPNSPINVIRVPAGNSRFRALGVRSGDLLKYFVLQDKTVDDESRQIGLSVNKAMDLKIAQVIDDNILLIEKGLNQEVGFLAKIEIWRNVDTRLAEINDKLVLYDTRRLPPLGWEPAPDDTVMVQVLAWLNQWIRQSNPPSEWKRDPLLESLPAELSSDAALAPDLSAESLAAKSFQPHESRILQEAVWLRDISRWAHGDAFDDVGRASALFDWTVRNIQLDADADAPPHRPWHTLLYGRGTADQRAWVFAALCRQQGLHVVMLGIPLAKPADGNAATYWLPALFSNNQLYLFDTRLGLPIPGPNGQGVATLDQVLKDDALLRKLDLEGAAYPLSAGAAQKAQAFIVADPFELTRRAGQLEASLSGADHLALSVKPSDLAAQLKSSPGVTAVSLWEVPFRTLRDQRTLGKSARHQEALAFEPFAVRPTLWKARTRHFQGRREATNEPGGEALDDHQEAARLYMSKAVRPTDIEIAKSPSADKQRVDSTAKQYATYWLGLLSYDDEKYGVAANWFARPELNAADSPWAAGASYNLARSLEAEQKYDEAIAILEKDKSPQQHGNKLRARGTKVAHHPRRSQISRRESKEPLRAVIRRRAK